MFPQELLPRTRPEGPRHVATRDEVLDQALRAAGQRETLLEAVKGMLDDPLLHPASRGHLQQFASEIRDAKDAGRLEWLAGRLYGLQVRRVAAPPPPAEPVPVVRGEVIASTYGDDGQDDDNAEAWAELREQAAQEIASLTSTVRPRLALPAGRTAQSPRMVPAALAGRAAYAAACSNLTCRERATVTLDIPQPSPAMLALSGSLPARLCAGHAEALETAFPGPWHRQVA